MRIAFLCGSLQPGKDGVGDYSRLLAAELARQGHRCLLVALNDRWLSDSSKRRTWDTPDSFSPDGRPVSGELRLAAILSWKERMERVRETLDSFQPDVISLQFVPYAFHDKGLVGGFARHLLDLLTTREKGAGTIHVMCHELWLGGRSSLPVRQRLVGSVQRSAILKMLGGFSPGTVVHTSNTHYRNRLQRGGIKGVRTLPLFGNIPVEDGAEHEWLFSRLHEAGIETKVDSRGDYLIGGFFGSLQPYDWSAEPLLGCLIRAAECNCRRLVLLSAGRIGTAGAAEWDRLTSRYAEHIAFVHFGEMESAQLSQYLSLLDFGLASTRLSVIGKSGAVAAMLEHGIPVLCSYTDLAPEAGVGMEDDARAENLLFRSDQPDFEDRVAAGLPHLEPVSRLREIACRMLNDLNDTNGRTMAQ